MKILTLADIQRRMDPKIQWIPLAMKAIAEEMGQDLILEWADAITELRYRSRSQRRIFAQRWMQELREPFAAIGGLNGGRMGGRWWHPLKGPMPGITMILNEKNTILDDIPWLR